VILSTIEFFFLLKLKFLQSKHKKGRRAINLSKLK